MHKSRRICGKIQRDFLLLALFDGDFSGESPIIPRIFPI